MTSSEPETEEAGLKPIGSLSRKIVSSLEALVSTPTPLPRVSATTGSRVLDLVGSSAIGRPPGGTGVARKPSESVDEAHRNDQRLLASLPLGVRLSLEYGPPEYDCIGFRPRVKLGDDVIAHALKQLEPLIEPAGEELTIKELTRCFLLTKARSEDQADTTMLLAILAEELSVFPGDVVQHVLRLWARREIFRPTLAELIDRCQRACRLRYALRDSLTA